MEYHSPHRYRATRTFHRTAAHTDNQRTATHKPKRKISMPIIYQLHYTGHTQNNGAVLILFTIKTAPFFCVCPVLCNPIIFIQFS
jgi:hypothetical protein